MFHLASLSGAGTQSQAGIQQNRQSSPILCRSNAPGVVTSYSKEGSSHGSQLSSAGLCSVQCAETFTGYIFHSHCSKQCSKSGWQWNLDHKHQLSSIKECLCPHNSPPSFGTSNNPSHCSVNMRGLISDNFEACITHSDENDTTAPQGRHCTLWTPAPFCCTWLKDRYEGQVWGDNEIPRPERKSESPKFQNILQIVTPGLQCHQEGEKLKDAAASGSRHLHSSPAPPEGPFWGRISSAQGPAGTEGHGTITSVHSSGARATSCDSCRHSWPTALRIQCTPVTRGSGCCSPSQVRENQWESQHLLEILQQTWLVRRNEHGLCAESCALLKCTRVSCRLGKLSVLFWCSVPFLHRDIENMEGTPMSC